MQAGLVEVIRGVVAGDPLFGGVVGGLFIAAMNLLGASVVLVWRDPSERALDGALGFAAGVMLFVVSDEIVSETHTRGNERLATLVLIAGTVVMLYRRLARLTQRPGRSAPRSA